MAETKEFDSIICNGTGQAENISGPIGGEMMKNGVRCQSNGKVYDYMIADMHPYDLNEIAAGGQGNELIGAVIKRKQGNKKLPKRFIQPKN
ncbi:hypothetical protein ABPG72_015440 [Tetrahymena utriculariae]